MKIIVDLPENDNREFVVLIKWNISTANEGESGFGEELRTQEGMTHPEIIESRKPINRRVFTVNTARFDPCSGFVSVYSADLEERIGHEHGFHVLDRSAYEGFWKQLIDGEWDRPLEWPDVDSQKIDELLQGLPVAELLFALPDNFKMNPRSFYYLLPALITMFMKAEARDLPFDVYYQLREYRRAPAIDLTRLTWLFNVLGPVLADFVFFAARLVIAIEVDKESCQITFKSEEMQYRFPFYDAPQTTDVPLITFLQENIGDDMPHLFRVRSSGPEGFCFSLEAGLGILQRAY